MRTIARLFPAIAAVLAFAAAPAAAQTLATDIVRPAAPAAAVARVVATYRFVEGREHGIPVEVTIADRAGELTATYRVAGKGEALPMWVTARDSDLLLSAETPQGVLMLVLEDANEATAAGPVRGRWTLGERSGDVRGWTRVRGAR